MARLNPFTLFLFSMLAALLAAPLHAQTAKPVGGPKTNTIIVGGDVATLLTITPADLKGYPRTTVKIVEEDQTHTCSSASSSCV